MNGAGLAAAGRMDLPRLQTRDSVAGDSGQIFPDTAPIAGVTGETASGADQPHLLGRDTVSRWVGKTTA